MALPLALGLLAAGFGYRGKHPDSPTRREIAARLAEEQQRRPELFRDRRCELAEDQDATQFARECATAAEGHPGESTLLWGDSHAAHLAPGIRAQAAASGFAQLTATSCPPILGYAARGRPHCSGINRWTFEWVRRHRPRIVLLAASWPSYDGYRALAGTIKELTALNGPRVVVVGPFPSYRERVTDVLSRESTAGGVPERLANSRLPRLREADAELRAIALESGARIRLAAGAALRRGSCLVAPGGAVDGILVFDQSHLTAAGSRYVSTPAHTAYLR